MVDWTILSPAFLTALVEWAVAAVTVLAVGPGHPTKHAQGRREERRRESFRSNPVQGGITMANSTIDAARPVVDRNTVQAELATRAPFICAIAAIQSFGFGAFTQAHCATSRARMSC